MTRHRRMLLRVTFAADCRDRQWRPSRRRSRNKKRRGSPPCSSSPTLERQRRHRPTPLPGLFTLLAGFWANRRPRRAPWSSSGPRCCSPRTTRHLRQPRPPGPLAVGRSPLSFPGNDPDLATMGSMLRHPPQDAPAPAFTGSPTGSSHPPLAPETRCPARHPRDNRRRVRARGRDGQDPFRRRAGLPEPVHQLWSCAREGASASMVPPPPPYYE